MTVHLRLLFSAKHPDHHHQKGDNADHGKDGVKTDDGHKWVRLFIVQGSAALIFKGKAQRLQIGNQRLHLCLPFHLFSGRSNLLIGIGVTQGAQHA